MTALRAWSAAAAVLAALALSACATAPAPVPVAAPPSGAWTAMAVDARRIGLGLPGGARLERGVRFAGGFELKAESTSPFHSLSDIKESQGWFYVVSDAGALFRFRLSDDAASGEPVRAARFEGRALTLTDGRPIADKVDGDAEGLAVTDSGDLLVSFERDHRIWSYGPAREPRATPTPVRRPDVAFPLNDGMEAISIRAAPGCGLRPCLRVAGESGGLWDCAPDGCIQVVAPPAEPIPDSEYRITGMDRDPGGDGYWVVERRFRPPVDARGRIRRMAGDGSLGPVLVELSLPSTVDNFEGVAAVAQRDGVRLYILSDDNGSDRQRTLLLAFDVTPVR